MRLESLVITGACLSSREDKVALAYSDCDYDYLFHVSIKSFDSVTSFAVLITNVSIFLLQTVWIRGGCTRQSCSKSPIQGGCDLGGFVTFFETHCMMCFDKAIATSSSAVAKRPRDYYYY